MGIVHFMPVGCSPGAVTSALSYIIHNPDFREPYPGAPCQDLVVFCSRDVYFGETPAEKYHWNQYGKHHPRQGWKQPPHRESMREVLREFLKKEGIREQMTKKGHLYFWPIDDVDDFESCFRAIATAALALGRPSGVGRLLWANLTGGTNILNSALLEVAFLSGLFGKIFYAFIKSPEDQAYLQPVSTATDQYSLRPVPLIKCRADEHYYRVLKGLDIVNGWLPDDDLLKCLKQGEHSKPEDEHYFNKMDLPTFRAQVLNKMDDREIERERVPKMVDGEEKEIKGQRNRIASAGRESLNRLADPLFQALVDRGQVIAHETSDTWVKELQKYRDDDEEGV